jgi:hypothetical protein
VKFLDFILVVGCLLGTQLSFADPLFEIIPGKNVGAITASSSKIGLEKSYGVKNVRAVDVDVGEGMTEKGAVIFPDDPKKKVEIIWKSEGKNPSRIQITGKESLWKTKDGISLGTSLKSLEKLNEKPFVLAGFGWDYAGTILSWNDGKLEKLKGLLMLRLDEFESSKLSAKEQTSVAGDKDFPSSNQAMQKINPKVYQIVITFP